MSSITNLIKRTNRANRLKDRARAPKQALFGSTSIESHVIPATEYSQGIEVLSYREVLNNDGPVPITEYTLVENQDGEGDQ